MLIVCPNTAIDHTVTLNRLHPGAVQRTGPARSAAGGKGANVARAARALGGNPHVLTFVADDGGDRLRELFAAEHLPLAGVPIGGQVRICTVLIEADGRVTLLNEPGAAVDDDQWDRLLANVRPGDAQVIGTGSLPPGAPTDGYARLVELVHSAGGECAVDTGRAALRIASQAGADLVCPNLSEAQAVVADPSRQRTGAGTGDAGDSAVEQVDERADDIAERATAAAEQLVGLGSTRAAVTAGSAGVALADGTGTRWLPAVPVVTRNPIGAGDSFLAGTMLARQRGASWTAAVRFGMATAASSVEQPGAAVVDPVRVAELDAALRALHGG